jgi:hypothetical protein
MTFATSSILFRAAALFLVASGLAPAAEFHVFPSGNSTNSGTPAAMLRTISEAAAQNSRAITTAHVHRALELLPWVAQLPK